jgi:hypothetical protein
MQHEIRNTQSTELGHFEAIEVPRIRKRFERFGVKEVTQRLSLRKEFTNTAKNNTLHTLQEWHRQKKRPITSRIAGEIGQKILDLESLEKSEKLPDPPTLSKLLNVRFEIDGVVVTLLKLLTTVETAFQDYKKAPNDLEKRTAIFKQLVQELHSPKIGLFLHLCSVYESLPSGKKDKQFVEELLKSLADTDTLWLEDIAKYQELFHVYTKALSVASQTRKESKQPVSLRQCLAEASVWLLDKGHHPALLVDLFEELQKENQSKKVLNNILESVTRDFIGGNHIAEWLPDRSEPAEARFNRFYKMLALLVMAGLASMPVGILLSQGPAALQSLMNSAGKLWEMYDGSRLEDFINIEYTEPPAPAPTAAPRTTEGGLPVAEGETSPAETAELLEINREQLLMDVQTIANQPRQESFAAGNGTVPSTRHFLPQRAFIILIP